MKDNKLIAEFMDYTHVLLPVSVGLEYYFGDEMEYHSSWDWLMPVVEKIFSLGYDYEIKPRYMVIKERLSSEVLVSKCFVYDKSQKEIIYDAVVEFINEYNKNK